MAGNRYAIFIRVPRRMEKQFSREEIETAARVMFFSDQGMPPDCNSVGEISTEWASDLVTGMKVVRAIGNVVSGN